MKFDYEEITPYIRRPIIPVFLQSETTFAFYWAIIDSGSDYCIFSLEVAKFLNITIDRRRNVRFKGINNFESEGYQNTILLRIGNVSYKTDVIFADISDFGHGVLGQRGFFDHFDVTLQYKKKSILVRSVGDVKN